jgi:hypothetical protein
MGVVLFGIAGLALIVITPAKPTTRQVSAAKAA